MPAVCKREKRVLSGLMSRPDGACVGWLRSCSCAYQTAVSEAHSQALDRKQRRAVCGRRAAMAGSELKRLEQQVAGRRERKEQGVTTCQHGQLTERETERAGGCCPETPSLSLLSLTAWIRGVDAAGNTGCTLGSRSTDSSHRAPPADMFWLLTVWTGARDAAPLSACTTRSGRRAAASWRAWPCAAPPPASSPRSLTTQQSQRQAVHRVKPTHNWAEAC